MVNWILVIEVCFCLVAVFMFTLMLLCYVRRRMRGEMGPITQKYKNIISDPIQKSAAALVSKTNDFATLVNMDGANREAKELLSSDNTRVSTEMSEINMSSEDAFMITKDEPLTVEELPPPLPPAAPVLHIEPTPQNMYENIEQLKRGFASFACSKSFQLSSSTHSSNPDYTNDHVINDSFDSHILGAPYEKRQNTHAVRFSRLKEPVIYENSIMEKKNAYDNRMRNKMQCEQGLMNRNGAQMDRSEMKDHINKSIVQALMKKHSKQSQFNVNTNSTHNISSSQQNIQNNNGNKFNKNLNTCSQWVERHANETSPQKNNNRVEYKDRPQRKPEETCVNIDDGSIDQLYQNTRRKKLSVTITPRSNPPRQKDIYVYETKNGRRKHKNSDGAPRYNGQNNEEICLIPGNNCYPEVHEYYPQTNVPLNVTSGPYNDHQPDLNTYVQFEEPFEEDILFEHKGFDIMDNNCNNFIHNGEEMYDVENSDFISPRSKPSVRFSDHVNEETYEVTDISESYNDDPFLSTDDDENKYSNGNNSRHNKSYRRPSETYRQTTYGYSGLPDLFDIKEEEEDNNNGCMGNNGRSQKQEWVKTNGCYKESMQNNSNWGGKIPFEKYGISILNDSEECDPYELKEVSFTDDPEYEIPCDVENINDGRLDGNSNNRHFSRRKSKKSFRKLTSWRNSDLYESDISTRSHRDSYESSEGQFADAEDNVEYSRVRRKHLKYNYVDEDSGIHSISVKKKSRSRKHSQHLQNYQNVQQTATMQPIGRDHLNMEGRSMFR